MVVGGGLRASSCRGRLSIPSSPPLPPRSHPPNSQRFNAWIDAQRAASPQTGLAVYPEGHRSVRDEPLPLKRGMLYYAFSRKLPVQARGWGSGGVGGGWGWAGAEGGAVACWLLANPPRPSPH